MPILTTGLEPRQSFHAGLALRGVTRCTIRHGTGGRYDTFVSVSEPPASMAHVHRAALREPHASATASSSTRQRYSQDHRPMESTRTICLDAQVTQGAIHVRAAGRRETAQPFLRS